MPSYPRVCHQLTLALVLTTALVQAPAAHAQATYYPAPGDQWERRTAEQVGLVAAQVQAAVDFALANASTSPPDLLAQHLRSFGREPYGEATGPFRERGEAAGLIIRSGYIVAEWGDTRRVDPTFSVTKSFLSTTVGLAFDRGMIPDLNATVRESFAPVVALRGPPGGDIAPGVRIPATGEGSGPVRTDSVREGVAFAAFEVILPFESEHNRRITWDMLLRQTSEWQGTLWGKPDWADRPRGDTAVWRTRERPAPGTVYTYNDARVNLLALAALNVWRRPLPQVLKEHVMDPIGASHTWRWFGYDNSWVVIDGQLVQSVSGGAHWGGGMWISARDMARFGYLTLRRGKWGDRQLLSERWIAMATTPGIERTYGFMNFFLNTGRSPLPAAPAEAFYHVGAGNNLIYVDPVHDLVIVTRWINSARSLNGVIERVLTGARPAPR